MLTDPGAAPEPVRLAAALDAAGAAFVPTLQTVAGRRAAELRATRQKRRQRVRLAVALVALAVAALAGPPVARWVAGQIDGGGEPLAPEVPAIVDARSATD